MRQLIKTFIDNIVTPFLKHLAPMVFLLLIYVGYSFLRTRHHNDVIIGKEDSGGWTTLYPGFIERKELPKDYSVNTYNMRVVYNNGHALMQIRKK
jgi:hypothetical protein